MILQIEKLAKLIPIALASAYVAGFIIIAFRLAKYGLSTLDLFKAQFIAAGLWYGLLSASILLPYISIRTVIAEPLISLYNRQSGRKLSVDAETQKLIEAGLGFVVLGLIGIITKTTRSGGFLQFTLALLLLEVAIRLWIVCRGRRKVLRAKADFESYLSLLLVAVIAPLSIAMFGITVYPKIPFEIGGGRTRRVVFWLSRSPATGTQQGESFLERQPGSDYTIPYELLNENQNSFVVISPKDGQRSIEFDRKAVEAMIVLGKSQSVPDATTQPAKSP